MNLINIIIFTTIALMILFNFIFISNLIHDNKRLADVSCSSLCYILESKNHTYGIEGITKGENCLMKCKNDFIYHMEAEDMKIIWNEAT